MRGEVKGKVHGKVKGKDRRDCCTVHIPNMISGCLLAFFGDAFATDVSARVLLAPGYKSRAIVISAERLGPKRERA